LSRYSDAVERGLTASLKFCPVKQVRRALEKAMRSYGEVFESCQ
jgi:hypothetical protein